MAQTSRSSPAIGGAVPTQCKYALNWTRLSCHRFVANQVRLWLFVLAYNLGNFMRRLTLPESVKHWSLRSVQTKRGGLVCLNSAARFDKWNRAAVR